MPPYLTSRGCWGTGGDVTCPGLHTWRVLSLGFELRSTQIFPPACFTKGTEKLNQQQGLHRLNSCQILTMWPEAGAPSSTHIRWSHIASLELLSPRGAAAGSGCASPSWAESEGHVSVITVLGQEIFSFPFAYQQSKPSQLTILPSAPSPLHLLRNTMCSVSPTALPPCMSSWHLSSYPLRWCCFPS